RATPRLFIQLYGAPPDLHSFPTRRSSDLEREVQGCWWEGGPSGRAHLSRARCRQLLHRPCQRARGQLPSLPRGGGTAAAVRGRQDRKSTRLNSSHGSISYAVFCLKKKR